MHITNANQHEAYEMSFYLSLSLVAVASESRPWARVIRPSKCEYCVWTVWSPPKAQKLASLTSSQRIPNALCKTTKSHCVYSILAYILDLWRAKPKVTLQTDMTNVCICKNVNKMEKNAFKNYSEVYSAVCKCLFSVFIAVAINRTH